MEAGRRTVFQLALLVRPGAAGLTCVPSSVQSGVFCVTLRLALCMRNFSSLRGCPSGSHGPCHLSATREEGRWENELRGAVFSDKVLHFEGLSESMRNGALLRYWTVPQGVLEITFGDVSMLWYFSE